jgi:hypothetical protein
MTIWAIFRPFGKLYGTFGNFVVIWYISHVLVYCTTKTLATLVATTLLNWFYYLLLISGMGEGLGATKYFFLKTVNLCSRKCFLATKQWSADCGFVGVGRHNKTRSHV